MCIQIFETLLAFYWRRDVPGGDPPQPREMGIETVEPVGALAEQIGEGAAGWIADEASGASFAAALTHMLDHPEERVAKATAALDLAHAAWNADDWDWLRD